MKACVKGCARSPYLARLAGILWNLLLERRVAAWFEWVHTRSNPLDALTRPGWKQAAACLGIELVQTDGSLSVRIDSVIDESALSLCWQ